MVYLLVVIGVHLLGVLGLVLLGLGHIGSLFLRFNTPNVGTETAGTTPLTSHE